MGTRDPAFLKPGLDELEFIISRPTVGVIPYIATDTRNIFDNQVFQQEILNNARLNSELPGRFGSALDYREFKVKEYNLLADIVRSHIDPDRIKGIIFS